MAISVGAGVQALGSWARRGFVALLSCLLFSAFSIVSGPSVAAAHPSVDEIIANVRAASGEQPERIVFRQDIELRVLVFRWTFYTDVTRTGDTIEVQVHGAPSFLSPDVPASLLEVSEGLDGFTMEFVEQVDRNGTVLYVLRGTAKAGNRGGARGGTIWVNGRTWLVDEAILEYDWGNLTLQQTFQTVNGFTLLREQYASVDRLGSKLRVQYGGYSFDEH